MFNTTIQATEQADGAFETDLGGYEAAAGVVLLGVAGGSTLVMATVAPAPVVGALGAAAGLAYMGHRSRTEDKDSDKKSAKKTEKKTESKSDDTAAAAA